MNQITFTGNWDKEDEQIINTNTTKVREQNPGDIIVCIYDPRPRVVPYRAIVTQRGRTQRPVAYSAEALAENIRNCF